MKFNRTHGFLRHAGRVLALQIVGVLVSTLCSGCATTGYFGDRMHDAGDVFTATVGMGAGAKARVGPVQLGILGNVDMMGLRGGQFGDVTWYETYTHDFLLPWPSKGRFGEETFAYQAQFDGAHKRGKGFRATAPLPVLGIADQPEYYTQIDIVVAIIGSVRLGFNPGELVDFILGWTTIDIYGDDGDEKEVNDASHGTALPSRP